MMNPMTLKCNYDAYDLSGVNKVIVPFLACGDLNSYDSDSSYALEVRKK